MEQPEMQDQDDPDHSDPPHDVHVSWMNHSSHSEQKRHAERELGRRREPFR